MRESDLKSFSVSSEVLQKHAYKENVRSLNAEFQRMGGKVASKSLKGGIKIQLSHPDEEYLEIFRVKLFDALGIFLPLITTNCAILGMAIFNYNREHTFAQGLFYALGAGAGLTLALIIMAGLREETDVTPPASLAKGTAMSFLIAGILSMAFMGFAGLFSSAA